MTPKIIQWSTPKLDWKPGDEVFETDMNRVEGNTLWIKENFEARLNEIFKNVDSTLTPINGWELTGNNIGRITKFGIGISILEVEMRAVQNIELNSVAFNIPEGFRPRAVFMTFTYSKGAELGSGFIYKNGQVKLNGTFNKGTTVAISTIIIN